VHARRVARRERHLAFRGGDIEVSVYVSFYKEMDANAIYPPGTLAVQIYMGAMEANYAANRRKSQGLRTGILNV
jgi:hypothetical protein